MTGGKIEGSDVCSISIRTPAWGVTGERTRYRLDIPDDWALEIISDAELEMLKSLSKEG